MDKTIVTSPEKRNDTSSFGGLDASHIDSAVRALRRSGAVSYTHLKLPTTHYV